MEVLVASPHHPSAPKPSRRGRPKKVPDTDVINARREKNRVAQREFRIRQQASERDQKRRFASLEATTSRVVSIFLDVADVALQSPWAQKDAQLMSTLRQSITDILGVVSDARVVGIDVEAVKAEASSWENELAILDDATMASCTKQGDATNASRETICRDHKDEASSEPTSTSSPSTTTTATLLPSDPITTYTLPYPTSDNSVAKPPPRLAANIFGNGWMGPMASYDFFSHPGASSSSSSPPALDSPLTLQITFLTLQRGYHALLHARDLTEPRIHRAFGYLLQRCSRDEILRSLRWRLSRPSDDDGGGGVAAAAELSRLATATLSQSSALFDLDLPDLDDHTYNKYATIVPSALAVFEDLCNADELAAMLRQRTRGGGYDSDDVDDTDGDVLEVAVASPPSVLLSEDTMFLDGGHVTFPWRANTRKTHTAIDNDPERQTQHIRVSKSILLSNISVNGTCLGAGPMFPRSKLDSIILASALPSHA